MRTLVGLARAVALALAGVVVGVASVAVHALTPGLLLALAATAAAGWALPGGVSWRLPFLLGWGVVVGRASVPRGSGSYLVASDGHGYVLLVGAVALLVFAVVTVRRREPGPGSNPAAESEGASPVS